MGNRINIPPPLTFLFADRGVHIMIVMISHTVVVKIGTKGAFESRQRRCLVWEHFYYNRRNPFIPL